jgi:hypothetical protein
MQFIPILLLSGLIGDVIKEFDEASFPEEKAPQANIRVKAALAIQMSIY